MSLPLVMLVVLVALICVTLITLAHEILHPPRMTDGKATYLLKRLSPGDLGMQFEELRFNVRDHHAGKSLSIAAWWIPHPAGGDKTAILIHGYADAKVGSIAWAPTWRELGYHILAIDLRAHGQSDGYFTTGGVAERHDLDQIINEIRALRSSQTREVVLFGISLGALVALGAAELRQDIAALVLDSPVVSFRHGVAAQVQLLALPLPSMLPAVMRIAEHWSHARFDEIQPLTLMAKVPCPLLVMQSGKDQFVSSEDMAAIQSAISLRPTHLGLAECWTVPGVAHLMPLPADPDQYRQRIGDFLRKARS